MKRGIARFFAAVVAVASLSGAALAQDIVWNSEGSGTLSRGGESTRIQSARVVLSDNERRTGYVEITGSKVWRFEGRWRERGDDLFELQILNAYDDPNADGTVEIRLRNNKISRISIDGYAKGNRFSVSFTSSSSSGSGGSSNFTLNQTVRGTGSFVLGRNRDDLSNVKVDLRRNGEFVITFGSGRNDRIAGDWESDQRGRAELTVREGLGYDRLRGDGTIRLTSDNRSIQSIDITGRASGEDYRLRFETERVPATNFSLNSNQRGRGNYAFGRDEGDVDQVNLDLNRNGSFVMDIKGRRNMRITGTYTIRGDEASLRVDNFASQPTRGTGTVRLGRDRKSFTNVSLSGRADETAFSLSFRATDERPNPGREDQPGREPVDTGFDLTWDGNAEGSFVLEGSRSKTSGVRLEAKRDGKFSLSLTYGETTQLFSGTYRVSGDRLILSIDFGFGTSIRGEGSVTLGSNRRGVQSLRGTGTWNRKNFSFEYPTN